MSDHYTSSTVEISLGTRARSSEVNAISQAVETAFTALEAEIDATIAALVLGGVAFTKITKTQANSPYAVTAGNLAGTYCIANIGATGECICNLPAGAATYRIAFYVAAAQNLKVVANGTEKFRFLANQTAAGGYIQSSTVGTFWIIEWIGTEWVVTKLVGSLTHAAGIFDGAGGSDAFAFFMGG